MSSSLIAAALAVALMPALASAAEQDTQSTTVSLRGINVGTATGAKQLQQRVLAAARQVCGVADTRDLQAMADMQACREAAMQQAAPQLLVALASAHLAARDSLVAAR